MAQGRIRTQKLSTKMQVFNNHIGWDQAPAKEHGYGKIGHIPGTPPEMNGGTGERIGGQHDQNHIQGCAYYNSSSRYSHGMEEIVLFHQILISGKGKLHRKEGDTSGHCGIAAA